MEGGGGGGERVVLAMVLLEMCGEMLVVGREAWNEQDGEYRVPIRVLTAAAGDYADFGAAV